MIIKNIFIGFATCMLSVSCISFKSLDTSLINKKIQYNIALQNPGEVMQEFYPAAQDIHVFLDWKELRQPKSYKITMIHQIQNDSIGTLRYIMYVTYNGETWFVEKIKQSVKCPKAKGIIFWRKNTCE